MIKQIQRDHAVWLAENFPNYEAWECVVGAQEELGELAAAFLKAHQCINKKDPAAERDAVGDIIIFLMGFCTARGYAIEDCIREAWSVVRTRNKRNPGAFL